MAGRREYILIVLSFLFGSVGVFGRVGPYEAL